MLRTIDAYEQPDYQGDKTSLELRYYANKLWIDSDNQPHIAGHIGSENFFQSVACPVSSGVITIPSHDVNTTTDASHSKDVKLHIGLWDDENNLVAVFVAPTNTTTGAITDSGVGNLSIPNIIVFNDRASARTAPQSFYDYVLVLLDDYVMPDATTGGKGGVRISKTPAGAPIAVGVNENSYLALNREKYPEDYSNLSALVAAIGSVTAATITISQPTNQTTSLDLSATLIRLKFTGTGKIVMSANRMLTVAQMENPGNRHVFDTSASNSAVRFAKRAVWGMNIAWMVADDTVNCTSAFSQFFASITANGSGLILLPEGNWKVTPDVLTIPARTSFIGCGNHPDGARGSTIIAASVGGFIFKIGVSTYGINFNDLTIDGDSKANDCVRFAGTAGNTSGYVNFTNTGLVRAVQNGGNVDSTDGIWQVTQVNFYNSIFLNNGNAGFRCDSINGSYNFDGTNFSVPASGYALDLVKSGAMTLKGCEFVGAPGYLWVKQKVTNTVVSAAGITGNGNAKAVVTASGLSGSPITVSVPVTTGAHTTAALIATAFRTALAANSVINAFFNIGGTGAAITLERKVPVANDATQNFTIQNDTCTGITNSLTATQTTAGVSTSGMAEAVCKIGGAHPPIVFGPGCQDEGFKHHTINNASDLESIVKYDGALVHADILLNNSCTMSFKDCGMLSYGLVDAAAVTARIHAENCVVEARDQYNNVVNPPVLFDFSLGGSIVYVEENAVNNKLKYRLPAEFLTDKAFIADTTTPQLASGHYAPGGGATKPLFRFGLTDILGTFLYYYDWYRQNSGDDAGRAKMRGNQTGFTGFDLENGDLFVEGAVRGQAFQLTDDATVTADPRAANYQCVTLGGNRTLAMLAFANTTLQNKADGQIIVFEIKQDATGSRLLTLSSGAGQFAFGTDITSITLTTAANKRDLLTVQYSERADRWLVTDIKHGFA